MIIDNYNGIDDLKNKMIKTPLDPDKTFFDDPLRIMRAFRFASKLNFAIDHTTLSSISVTVKDLKKMMLYHRKESQMNFFLYFNHRNPL